MENVKSRKYFHLVKFALCVVVKSEAANILSTEHKVVLLSEFDLEDILYVDDEGNIKER